MGESSAPAAHETPTDPPLDTDLPKDTDLQDDMAAGVEAMADPTLPPSDPPPSDPPVRGRWIFLTAAVVGVLALDQITKTWAVRRLAPPPLGNGDVIDLVGSLRFRYAENTGMAFSRGASSGPWIALVAVTISVALVLFAAKARTRLQVVLMGIVIGGALGNVLDRAFRGNSFGLAQDTFMGGAVVDFVDLQWWPVFNVADAAIVCGGIALVIFGSREPKAEPPADAERPSAGGPTSA